MEEEATPQIRRKSKQKKMTLSQTQSEVIIDLQKRYFDDDNNMIDYFIEVGMKPEIFKNKILYEISSPEEINNILIPQIITKFPSFDKKNVVIENSMIHQIFPQGYKLIISEQRPLPNFYCLILDNQLYSAIYTRKYLACLIVYESIEKYKKLYDKFQLENEKFLAVMKNAISKNTKDCDDKNEDRYKNFYIPKCLCLVSVHPYIDIYEEILRTIYDLTTNETYSYIFIDQIIEKLIIETPKIPRGVKRIKLLFPNNIIDINENKMNEYPAVNVNLVYTFDIMNYNNIIEIYKFLLYETKLIFFSEDLYKLTNTILSFVFLLTPFNYQFQIVSILSKELYNFIETISPFIFGINEKYEANFMEKYKISIEDTSICIVDIDNDNYFLITPGGVFNTKDFPEFPKKLRKKLEDKIKTYLFNKKKKKSVDTCINMGQNNKAYNYNKTVSENNILRSSTCKVMNCDNFLVSLNDIIACDNLIHKQNIKKDAFYHKDNQKIQEIFSRFMINLLKDYPKFLSKDYSVNRDISQNINDMIDLKSYLNLFNNGDRFFYSKIFSTQMFMEFIYKRMMPRDCNEKVDVLFFEEKINEKINEKNLFSKINKSKIQGQYILLNCRDYDYNQTVSIDLTAKKGVSNRLKFYILTNKSLLNAFLRRGYIISINEDSNELTFKYEIFPLLLSDKLFLLNSEDYQQENPSFYKEVELINTKIVNKTALKFIQEKAVLNNSETENDLYLCYIILWAMSFWYIEDDEKDSRFIEMMEILGKVEEHDIKIFEILFKTLVEYSKDENVILLYKKFIHLRLNPSWDMFSLVSKIIKKKHNINKKNKLLHQETNMSKLKEIYFKENKISDPIQYSKRAFKNQIKDDFVFSNNVLFYAYFICKKCNNIINLGKFCSDLKNLKMEKDTYGYERIKCNNRNKEGKACDNLCDQNFKYRLGEELFNQKIEINHRYFSSIPGSIILLTPKEIKDDLLRLATNKKKGEKFDIENFKFNYPDLFWSLIWYFDLSNIDKSFMLPYESTLKNNSIKKTNYDIKYLYNKLSTNDFSQDNYEKKENKDNDNKCNKKIIKINAKNNKNKFNIFKNKKVIKKYKKEDLCVQKVYDLAIIENVGLLSYKNLYFYEKNIAYNEFPLLPYDKDNFSVSRGSFLYNNDSESSTRASLLRDSLLSHHTLKRNTLASNGIKVSKLSKSGPGVSDIGLKLGTRDSNLTKCIVFEESDDSIDENNNI